jgi:predicted Rossmann fold nucleotide-binding protein DprA/Smf involved in DNA uptake
MNVAWTGHRPDLFRNPAAARRAVDVAAADVVRQGATRFVVGGQRGVDSWAAQAAIDQSIPLSIVLPLPIDTFTHDWTPADRALLEQILAQADDVRIAGGFTERNRVVATGADLLVAVWTRIVGGGTAETIELAREARTAIREIVLEPAPGAERAQGRGI